MHLDARRDSDSAPDGSVQRVRYLGRPRRARAAERVFDLFERPAGLLHRLDLQELLEVRRSVVIAPAQTERSRQQAFLDVVPDRAPGDAAQISQITDGVKDCVAHHSEYRQSLSHCQLSLYSRSSADSASGPGRLWPGDWGPGTGDCGPEALD